MATFHLIIHVFEHNDSPWTFSAVYTRNLNGPAVRYPIRHVSGTLPFNSVADPLEVLRSIHRRLQAE